MELFFEFALTILISLVVSFAFAKLVSSSSHTGYEHDCLFRSGKDETDTSLKEALLLRAESGLLVFEKKTPIVEIGEPVESAAVVDEDLSDDDVVRSRSLIIESFIDEAAETEKKAKLTDDDQEEKRNLIDESLDRERIRVTEIEDVASLTKHEGVIEVLTGEGTETKVEEDERVVDEHREEETYIDDDWEGIERTELERVFGSAVAFVDSLINTERISRLDSEVKSQLYALHRVAVEGPCHEAPPMALKITARSKWNAWQRLGNTSPDVAMEGYISLLSDNVPEWKQDNIIEDKSHGLLGSEASDSHVLHTNHPAGGYDYERNLKDANPDLEAAVETEG